VQLEEWSTAIVYSHCLLRSIARGSFSSRHFGVGLFVPVLVVDMVDCAVLANAVDIDQPIISSKRRVITSDILHAQVFIINSK
jgi:hypothetical protein